jgi:hypothetical protein
MMCEYCKERKWALIWRLDFIRFLCLRCFMGMAGALIYAKTLQEGVGKVNTHEANPQGKK